MLPVMRLLLSGKKIKYYTNGVEDVAWVEGYSVDTGSVSKEAACLNLIATKVTLTAFRTYVTDVAIDLTKIKRIYVDWENVGNSGGVTSYIIASTIKAGTTGDFNAMTNKSNTWSRSIDTLDVSSLSGLYYIRIHARSPGGTSNINTYRIWGE